MAIAIPLLMAAAGVAAEYVAAATIVGAVTGLNDKINSAAAKVFGEDLVQAFSVVGTVFNMGSAIDAGISGAGAAASEFGAGAANALPTSPDINPTDMRLAATPAASATTTASTAMPAAALPVQPGMDPGMVVPNPTDQRLAAGTQMTPMEPQPGILKMMGEGIDATGKWWSGLSPTTKQILGFGAMGLMQGYQRGKELDEARDERERLREIERTGSGLRYGENYTYQPARPVRRR